MTVTVTLDEAHRPSTETRLQRSAIHPKGKLQGGERRTPISTFADDIFSAEEALDPAPSASIFLAKFAISSPGKMANAASGMAVDDECKLKFLELKAKRTYRFIIFKIEEEQKQVVVEKLGEPSQSYEDFAASLPANECRYAVYDFDFVTEENCQKSRIFFIAWSPDTSRVRSKMIYASSKDRFKRELDGIQVELQATDPSEMGLDVIKSRAV